MHMLHKMIRSAIVIPCVFSLALHAGLAEDRGAAQKLMKDGNWKEALAAYRKLTTRRRGDSPYLVCEDLDAGIQCIRRLRQEKEFGSFVEDTVKKQKRNWRLLQRAANAYQHSNHYGFIIDGEFQRGRHRGGGKYANVQERDRIRALQLMDQAGKRVRDEKNANAAAGFYLDYARLYIRNGNQSWRMQTLTDIETLPDVQEGHYHGGGSRNGAPVDRDGKVVLHSIPETFKSAVNDGERWRWLLNRAVEVFPNSADQTRTVLADFLHGQFGVQTMQQYGWFFRARDDEDGPRTYDLHTLGETETICQLAGGIQRFELPDEFAFVKIYEQIAKEGNSNWKRQAISKLATIFENRRQYEKAVRWWRRYKLLGKNEKKHGEDRIRQIVGNWGQFETVSSQPAGRAATVEFRFRNGRKVAFTAYQVLLDKLLADVRTHIRNNPKRLDWNKINIQNLGRRLVWENQKKYIGSKVAEWSLGLKPRPNHFDKRITVTTPLRSGGAYLLVGEMADGNTSRIIIQLDDLVIVKKNLEGKVLYFVADAVSGAPVPKANVEFFGYRGDYDRKRRRQNFTTKHFAEFTDDRGQIELGPDRMPQRYQWLVSARKNGKLAYQGFIGSWNFSRQHDPQYNATRTFFMTDRPVYRPEHTVKWKAWVRHAKFDMGDVSDFSGQTFWVEIRDAKNERLFGKAMKADEFGGLRGELALKENAALGTYRMLFRQGHEKGPHVGNGTFRVEEYKKPEFEVTVEAPSEPVMLGETVIAKVKAKYYFGAPVTHAKVKVKVLRHNHSANWYPSASWDWLYSGGYWWFGYDYSWYPGWRAWGCPRPIWSWWHRPTPPPELVLENELEIGPDGTVEIPIDTALAKAMHGDLDHRYEITAEVRDQSRRTIVGTGKVLVARAPFKVYAWTHRGHYRVGDTIRASFQARRLDGKGVSGKGRLKLLKVTYADGKPVETEVQAWDLSPDAGGMAEQQLKASRPGQYRLSYTVEDDRNHTIEGGYVFVVRGEGYDGGDYRFHHIELVPDKKEYRPGEGIELMINTDRVGSTVLLFVRPTNGVYLPPRTLRLRGKSAVVTLKVTKKDMPNFFVEAITIADGKLHSDVRQIVVPPEKRVLSVEVAPSKDRFKPGEKGRARIRLTNAQGNPFAGSIVVTVYDKSVEYISGGSNIGDIRPFFWKWKRNHRENTLSTLGRMFYNLLKQKETRMGNLGVFGHLVADGGMVGDKSDGMAFGSEGGEGGHGRGGVRKMARMSKSKGMALGGAMMDGAAAAPAPRMMAMSAVAEGMGAGAGAPGNAPGESGAPAVVVRKNFADTALWVSSLETDANGVAEIDLPMPENLTTWKIKVWALGHGTKVGQGSAEVITSKDLILRMQAPRFFVQTDEVVLSANIHNYLKTEQKVVASIELDGPCLKSMGRVKRTVTVEPNGEVRVDWRVKALAEGEAVVRMKAVADGDADAMEMRFPVFVHGMDKMDSYCGVIRPDRNKGEIRFAVPDERRPETARLEVRYSPTLAMAMIDAVPYLAAYPHGCTEQTLNRFLPAVLTQRTLQRLGVSLKQIKEKRANLNAQEIGDTGKRAKQWKRYDTEAVWDEAELAKMVKDGVEGLTSMQCSDGGWGWFSGYGERSYPHTTAVVVHGLQTAVRNDVAVVPGVVERGIAWLKRYEAEQVRMLKNAEKDPKVKPWKSRAGHLDAMVYMVLADNDHLNPAMRDYLYRDRNHLSLYAKGMFALGLHQQKQIEKRDMLIRNMRQYLKTDDENQTAWLEMDNGSYWWNWFGDEIETHAMFLRLLAATEPKGDTAHRLVKYLLNNRKHATYWKNTRDTASCLEAFADYIQASGEDKPDQTIELWLDGKRVKEVTVNAATLFTFDNVFVLEGEALKGGKHKLELRKKGSGPLYYNAYVSYFTLEDFIPKTGLEVKIERRVYRLKAVDKEIDVAGSRNQALKQKVEKYERVLVENKDSVNSGDLIEIELVVESKNDYEYILLEDLKAAGFEPVAVRSGYNGNALGAYVEFRDEKVCFFVRRLMRGKHSVSYRLRAETPGRFSALPATIAAMYAPELRGNSDEIKLRVKDVK